MPGLLPTFFNLPKPAVIAHRGASFYAPENTLSAFEIAIKQNADAIELDVCLSKDGHVIVIHGPKVDRTTNGQGLVADMTLKQLQNLDAGSHFDPAYNHEKIPTLPEIFDHFGQQITINIELKNYSPFDDALPTKVAVLIDELNLQNFVLISSFNIFSLVKIRRLQPEVPTALLTLKGVKGNIARHFLSRLHKINALHPHYQDLSENLIKFAQKRRVRIHPYTINRHEDIKHVYQFGIDGIITDDPHLAINIRAELFSGVTK